MIVRTLEQKNAEKERTEHKIDISELKSEVRCLEKDCFLAKKGGIKNFKEERILINVYLL